MPDFLTIAGTAVPVAADGATQDESEEIGETARAFAGNLRSTVRAEKRQWTFTTPPLTHAAAATIRALAPAGTPVVCAGGFLDGPAGGASAVTCLVKFRATPYRPDYAGYPAVPLSFQRPLTFTLREV